MKEYRLEACVDSVESAIAAEKGGADRFELCSNLIIGGTTPTMELFRMVREHTSLPIHVLIRPRFGDFLYSNYEYERMCREIAAFAKEGADAVVIGSLNSDGSLNEEQMKGMIAAAGKCKITLHRAFDVCKNPLEVLEQAIQLGVNTILTSGQGANCLLGKELIKQAVEKGGDRIEILVGAGVSADVITEMVRETGAHAFHMSGKVTLPSHMEYRKPDVSMGLPGISEFEIWQTQEENIRRAVQVLQAL